MTILASHELGTIPINAPSLPSTGRRLAFARRLTSGTHPLTARVLMNRIWMHPFGRGIVSTPDDFGHKAVENTVTYVDYHATLLHLFGLEPKKLVYHRNGREQSLLDNQPCRIVGEILERV